MPDGGDWENERMEATYAEARAVLEAQNDTMSDIDTKAMRTVRFNVLLIGVLITAVRFAGSGVFHSGSLNLAIGLLVGSSVLGIATYNESNLYVGPRGEYVERLADDETAGQHWDRDLLETFAGMISKNDDVVRWNGWLLTATQGMLIFGIVAGILATVI